MHPETRAAIGQALGERVVEARAVAGGDINDAYQVVLSDGRRVFAKENHRASGAMFPVEARGLEWLAEARAIRVPDVLAVSAGESPGFLVLEWLEPGGRRRDFDELLGRGLAALHRSSPTTFGLDHDNFIGSLAQVNRAHDSWADFYRDERLVAQLALPGARRLLGHLGREFERLYDRLDELCGPPEPPARLHGDLWGGNLHGDAEGHPVLIDPAVYGGHREIDLAMMRLFGGFSARVFDAYDEAFPLADGHRERTALYQLYPLLVHVNLFGGGYAAQVESILRGYVA